MAETKDILEEIYSRLDLTALLKDLEPQDSGQYYILKCPRCGHKEAYIYKQTNYIKCNRLNKCDSTISLWDYVQESKQLTDQDTLKELARAANYPLNINYSAEKIRSDKEKADLLEAAQDYFKECLLTAAANETREYLEGRGYTKAEINTMGLGFFPPIDQLIEYLVNKGYSVNSVNNSGLKTKGFGDAYKLTIPYRDAVGRTKGFIVRAIDKDIDPKYKFSYGVEKDTPFNLHSSLRDSSLIVVEGFIDALILTVRGIKGVIAIGGSNFTETQINSCLKYKDRNFILSLDNDEAGYKGTEKAIDLLNRKGIKSYVVNLEEGSGKDPDEFLRLRSLEDYKSLLKCPMSAAQWRAKSLLSKHSLQSLQSPIVRDRLLSDALAFEETLTNPIDSKDFLDVITETLGIPVEMLEPHIMDYHKKKAQEKLSKEYEHLFNCGQTLLKNGNVTAIKDLLDSKALELQALSSMNRSKVYTLQDYQKDLTEVRSGLSTSFESLDKIISIPQEAITIVAGRPSHGKTTLLMNLFTNMVLKYPQKTFCFFSYEETKKKLTTKLINILGGESDQSGNARGTKSIENYLAGKFTGQHNNVWPAVEKGLKTFRTLSESKRLWLDDTPYYIDELANYLAFIASKEDIGAVFIDYIQKIKIKGKYQSRQIEIQKVSEQILEIAKSLHIPIILGAQFNRDVRELSDMDESKLREAGDIEQDANIVLGLWNEARNRQEKTKEPVKDPEVDLSLLILKNRDGIAPEKVTLTFNRPTLIIKNKQDI